MKTAMQQLLDKFREKKWYSADEIEQEFLDFGLPLEKEQIINDHLAGQNAQSENDGDGQNEIEYFNEQYEDGTN